MKKINIKTGSGCFLVNLEIYPMSVIVSINQNTTQAEKSLKKIFGKTPLTLKNEPLFSSMEEVWDGRCAMLDSNDVYITLYKIPEHDNVHGVLAHEIFHATTFIMYRIGGAFELNVSDEAYAYLLGFITKKIYEKLEF